MRSLEGKVALVTGGSSGIGAACVRLLAQEGARVVIGFNKGADRAQALLAELPGQGHRTLAFALDQPGSHQALAQRIEQELGRADILVNSAGYTQRIAHKDVQSLEPELFNQFLTANLGGTYSVTRAMLPLLQASGDGLVVNVSSVSAFTGSGSNMAYCAAKAGLDTLTQSLARALAPRCAFCASLPPRWTPTLCLAAAETTCRPKPKNCRWAGWCLHTTWRWPCWLAPHTSKQPPAHAS